MTHFDITVPVRWSDVDGYGHVNNATMLRLLEEARIRAFWMPSDEQQALGAFAFVMDTGWCDGALELARGADLLVCEATFLSSE